MRGAWVVAAVLAVGGVVVGPARAGVYNTAEPWPQPRPFKQFQLEWAGYRAAAIPPTKETPEQSPAVQYRRRVAELEAREQRGILSLDDRINLGAYYVRLQEPQKAIRLLEGPARQMRQFMLLANLASAYEQAGMLERALDYRGMALSAWPAMYPGWDTFQVNFYRKAEKYQLTLVQLRLEEARTVPPAERAELRLDNLFPRVRFVGAGGKYEAGGIAAAQWGELPNDATSVVEQMVLWSPFDERLLWLLGELLNANGDVGGSAELLKTLVNRQATSASPADAAVKWSSPAPPELREHYHIVAAEATAREKLGQALVTLNDPYLNLKLLCAVAPRGLGLGAGDLMQEASWDAIAIASAPATQAGPAPAPARSAATETWVPNWRQLAVGFGAGAVVALLLGMQVRQLGRPKR
jgi:hypothetical protein